MTAPTRTPGRPRSAEADQAIVRATLELLVTRGYEGLSVEDVRRRAGVGKATIYRRYASKPELVKAAIRFVHSDLPVPEDTGSFVTDFEAVALVAGERAQATNAAVMMPRLMSEAAQDPELFELFDAALVQPRRKVIAELVERAKARGEIGPDADVELVIDLIVGPMLYRLIISGGDLTQIRPPGEIVRAVLAGLSPR